MHAIELVQEILSASYLDLLLSCAIASSQNALHVNLNLSTEILVS